MPRAAGAHHAKAMKDKKKRAELEEKQNAQNVQLEEWMSKYDKSGDGSLSIDEFKSLMSDLKRQDTGDSAAVVSDELCERMLKECKTLDDGALSKTELTWTVKKYRALLKYEKKMEELFAKHDLDKNKVLDRQELTNLMSDLATERGVGTPSEGDIDFVMGKGDADGSGEISIDELGPAVSTWWEFAKDAKPGPPSTPRGAGGSSACVIL